MASTTTTICSSSNCSTFISVPTTPAHKFPTTAISIEFLHIDKKWSTFSISQPKSSSPSVNHVNHILCSSSTSSTPIIEEDEEIVENSASDELPLDTIPARLNQEYDSLSSMRGCKACGREEIERGCNGEGRIQGGIATVPGFGWWPIKAYRPCPGFVASGGRYRRYGQSMDEVAFGRGERGASMWTDDDEGQSRKKKQEPSIFKS